MKNNLLRVVRMTAYYSFLGLFLQAFIVNIVLAGSVEGQNLKNIKLNVNVTNVTLEQAFKVIEQETNLTFGYVKEDIPLDSRVTLKLESESLQTILEGLARDYSLVFNRINDHIVVKKAKEFSEENIIEIETGSIKGKVTDEKTGEALVGANIVIKGTTIGVTTDMRGEYRFDNLKTGEYTVVFRYVGYGAKSEKVEIQANRTVELNVSLGQSAYNLDEVTVTGTLAERSYRESAISISTLTPKDLENRNITDLNSIIKTLPGIVGDGIADQGGQNYRMSRPSGYGGTSSISFRGFSPPPSYFLSNTVKYIVDGAEVFDYDNSIRTMDPNTIEKIEVVRGPMGSTLYGAGSSSGIIQIFTKKKSGKNIAVNFRSMFTSIQDKVQISDPLNSEYSLSVRGSQDNTGYTLGANYSISPLTRWERTNGIAEKLYSISGSLFTTVADIKADVRLEYSKGNSGTYDYSTYLAAAKENNWNLDNVIAWYRYDRLYSDLRSRNSKTNASLNLTHIISDHIYHNLTLGFSNTISELENKTKSTSNTYSLSSNQYSIYNSKYFINFNYPLSPDLNMEFTSGAEYNYKTVSVRTMRLLTELKENAILNQSGGMFIDLIDATTGLFGEVLLGYQNTLFLTAGFRGEHNNTFGDNKSWYSMPRIGLSYVPMLEGDLKLKLRTSCGKSTQAPPALAKTGQVSGTILIVIPNPDLLPQSQSGYEVGTDLFYTDNYSLGFTYFNQTINDLTRMVDIPKVENYIYSLQWQNTSTVYNKGVEVSLRALVNSFTFDINATFIDSKNGPGGAPDDAYSAEGERTVDVPNSTFYARVSYNLPAFLPWSNKGGNISLDYRYSGSVRAFDYFLEVKEIAADGYPTTEGYTELPGYSLFGLRFDYAVFDNISFFMDIKNLLNNQDITSGALLYLQGRQISFGINANL